MSSDSIRRFSGKLPKGRSFWAFVGAFLVLAAVAFPGASFADSGVSPAGCDFFSTARNGTNTNLCSNPLAGSTFAGADGNLLTLPTNWGTTDWQNPPAPLGVGIDNASGSGDNSFGQGTKEDDPAVSTVTGSIPPNKSDLTRFYQATETVSGQTFLYLAWERTNVLGTANMDFEINQAATDNLGVAGKHTINRTGGDLLITFDFTNGGGKPILGLNTWLTSASLPVVPGFSTNVCLSANSFPCWGDHTTLNGSIAIGAVNSDTVSDPIQTGDPNACPSTGCPALTFGETAINLTGAGVFGTGTCKTFASTYLKSRASTAFTAEVKDFVAPIPTEISNCGQVTIIKHTDPRGVNQDFGYNSNVTGTTTVSGSTVCPIGSPAFTLNDNGNTSADSAGNTQTCYNVPAGSGYTVTERADPTGFVFESLTCSATGTGTSVTPASSTTLKTASITMAGGGAVTCTYVNQQQLGAIKITKTSSKAAATALPGAHFELCTNNGPYTQANPCAPAATGSGDLVTGDDGTVCVDPLGFGDYYVTETSPPTGYAADDTTTHKVTVDNNAACSDASYGGEAITFTDTPLTDITATATSEVAGGTKSHIRCVDSSNVSVGDSASYPTNVDPAEADANGLAPGVYTCTITIDP